ncbi:MAG: PLP-dependent transferase, partial [Burkholderiales bacterium]|nr:PLP-dependent transferase [Burkholderiales bacterium]
MSSLDKKSWAIETRVTKLGLNPQKNVSTISAPVFRGSTIAFPTFEAYEAAERGDTHDDITYGLQGLPTVNELQNAVAELEGAFGGLAVPSGLTATTLPLLALLNAGDHLLMVDNVYSPTRRFCEHALKRFNIAVDYYHPTVGGAIEKLF